MPAGLNNIVGIKPSKGLVSTRGVVPAAQSVDCVSIFAHTVGVAARVLQAAAGYDPLDPFSRRLTLTATPWPARFRFGVPAVLPFFGDSLAEAAFHQAVQKLCELCGTPATIDDAPLAGAAALLYDSALVAERYAAVRSFFDAHADEVIEPVRSIVAGGRNHSAADLVDAQVKLRAFGQQAAVMWDSIDVPGGAGSADPCTAGHWHADAGRRQPGAGLCVRGPSAARRAGHLALWGLLRAGGR